MLSFLNAICVDTVRNWLTEFAVKNLIGYTLLGCVIGFDEVLLPRLIACLFVAVVVLLSFELKRKT